MPGEDKGSRHHLESLLKRSDFLQEINSLLGSHQIYLSKHGKLQPNANSAVELTLRRYFDNYFPGLREFDRFRKYWVPDKYKNPTWDLLSNCSIEGGRGFLLVEAKAHEHELNYHGKNLEAKASEQSQLNHNKIRLSIEQARKDLNKKYAVADFGISIDKCYQLSNRIASAWKLADCGLQVVLLYLGFIGDTYFKDDYFIDDNHWHRAMGAYMRDVVPISFPGNVIRFKNGGSLLMLIKSTKVK
jgi:hypothetical protein